MRWKSLHLAPKTASVLATVHGKRNRHGVRHQFLYAQIFIIPYDHAHHHREQASENLMRISTNSVWCNCSKPTVKAILVKRPEPHPRVLEIERYVPSSNTMRGGATVFKLSSNETPLG
jgi:hypothetical protein